MAARLSAAGGKVDVRVYPGSPHGFTLHPTAMASTALDDIESWLAGRFLEPDLRPDSPASLPPPGRHARRV
jgi:acetyl esterase